MAKPYNLSQLLLVGCSTCIIYAMRMPTLIPSHVCSGQNNSSVKKRKTKNGPSRGNIERSNHFSSSLSVPRETELESLKMNFEKMKTLLSKELKHRGQLKENLLSLRALIMSLPPLSSATGSPPCTPLVVADMLLLLAHTRNLIYAHAYPKVVSPPIKVRARDLGSRVPISVLKKTSKLGGSESTTSLPCSSSGPSPSEPQISPPMRGNDRVAVVDIETGKLLKGLKAPKRENIDSFLIANPHYRIASPSEKNMAATTAVKKKVAFCEGDEVVNEVQITYEPHFVLAQLLQWHNEGHGTRVNKTLAEGLLGCVRIPDPSELCSSHKNWGKYTTETHRPLLLKQLEDVNEQRRPWPQELVEALDWSGKTVNGTTLFGSPIIDAALNDPSGLKAVTETFRRECGTKIEERGSPDVKKAKKSLGGGKAKTVAAKMDHDLPAGASAQPCNWVQCDHCLKWRRLPWFVNPSEDIKERFLCKDNQWIPESASCDAEEDAWDSEEEKGSSTTWNGSTDIFPKHLLKGIWIDAYCDKTCQWIPGKIIDSDLPGPSVRVHYFGWKKQFDENILCDSKRLAQLHARSKRVAHSNSWLAHNRKVICMAEEQQQ